MYQRQIFKTALTNKVLHDPRQRRLFSQKDLRDLLTLQGDSGSAKSGGDIDIETTGKVASAHKSKALDTRPDIESTSSDDGETLKKVFKSKGLAGVFDHDFVDPSSKSVNKSISVREMEERAEKIAQDAAKALEESVSDASQDQFEPTWTGATPPPSESRFGGGNSSRMARGGGGGGSGGAVAASSFGSADTAGIFQSNSNGGGMSQSSSALLASLRERNAAIKSGGSTTAINNNGSSSASTKYTRLLSRIRNYLQKHSPTTDELLEWFSDVKEEDAAVFRKLLKSIARSDRGRWKLK